VKDDRVYRGHIRDAMLDVERYGSLGRNAFMGEPMFQDAIIPKLEILGEAVKHLSDRAKRSRPEIPWKQIAGMRDRLTHDYFGLDLTLVWAVGEQDLPTRAEGLEPDHGASLHHPPGQYLLPPPPQDEEGEGQVRLREERR